MRIHAMVRVDAGCQAAEVERRVGACAEAGFDGVLLRCGDVVDGSGVEAGAAGETRVAGAAGDAGAAGALRLAVSLAAARGLSVWLDLSRVWARRESPEAFIAGVLEPLRVALGAEAFSRTEALWLGETSADVAGSERAGGAGERPLGVVCGVADGDVSLYLPEDVASAMARRGCPLDDDVRACLAGGDGERQRAVRVVYREALAEHVATRVLGPVATWCEARDVLLAATLEGEESPLLQVAAVGDALTALGAVSLPAVVALGRAVGNELYPRLAASAAAQSGRGRSAALALVGAGAGVSPADVERQLLWLGRCGITDVVLAGDVVADGSDVTTRTGAGGVVRGLPASLAECAPWAEVLPSVLDIVRASTAGKDLTDTLMVVPTRAIQETFTPSDLVRVDRRTAEGAPNVAAERVSEEVLSCAADAAGLGARFDVADEAALERDGGLRDCCLALGKARYQRVIAFSESLGSPVIASLLTCLGASGCKVDTPQGWLASLGKVTTSFTGMPETLAVGEAPSACAAARAPVDIASRRVVPRQNPWRITPPERNGFVFELAPCAGTDTREAEFRASAHFSESLSDADCGIVLDDAACAASWDGVPLALAPAGAGRRFAALAAEVCGTGEHVLRVRRAGGGTAGTPPAVLIGRFGVWSRLWPFDARHMTSNGSFEVHRCESLSELSGDLLESGYPFSFLPVVLTKRFAVEDAGTYRVALDGVRASAARITVDGAAAGDAWGSVFRSAPLELAAGEHVLEVRLYNSGYNVFGPHHHYLGDVGLVTPAQYAGERNFADPEHAPDHTRVESWHFLRWGLGEDVALEPA